MEAVKTLEKLEGELNELRGQFSDAREERADVLAASGKKLDTRRRKIQELDGTLEILSADIAVKEEEVAGARRELQAERRQAAHERLAGVEDEAEALGADLRAALQPVADILADIPDLDRRYRAAQRDVASAEGRSGGGHANTPATNPMGVPLGVVRKLNDIVAEVA